MVSFTHRARIVALCLTLCAGVGGCTNFDPGVITDLIPDTKKKLPGERQNVFPNGVPGVAQGVPPELVKGNQLPADAEVVAAPEPPKAEEKPKPKPRTAAPRRPPATVAPQAQQQQSGSPWPSGNSQQAQPQAQSQAAWPAPPAPAR